MNAMNFANEWFRYAIATGFIALGIRVCFVSRQRSFMRIGSARAPAGAAPIPRWVVLLMGLGFVFVGIDLAAVKQIAGKYPSATAERQILLLASCVCLAWGLGSLFAGLNTRADLLRGNISRQSDDYRSSAFLHAFVSLLFALAAAYFAFVIH